MRSEFAAAREYRLVDTEGRYHTFDDLEDLEQFIVNSENPEDFRNNMIQEVGLRLQFWGASKYEPRPSCRVVDEYINDEWSTDDLLEEIREANQ